ncbi:MAG: TIGR02444 family protein [Pseudomonadota bacterium]
MSRKIITGESLLGVASVLEHKKSHESALWSFATTVYADPAVSRAALNAQDEAGLDVNLLLFAAWLATRGVELDAALLDRAEARSRPWRQEVVQPLRRLRRSWKERPPHESAYGAIKDLELVAERKQLAFLEELVTPGSEMTGVEEAGARLTGNLRALRLFYGADGSALAAFEAAVYSALDDG